MSFLIFLICLAAERYLNLGEKLFRFSWFSWYARKLQSKLANSVLWQADYQIIATIILPLLIIIGLIYYVVGYWSFGIKFVIGLLIFLYCLGPYDLFHQVNLYLKGQENENPELAKIAAIRLLHGHIPEDPQHLNRAFFNGIFWQANESLFAVIFWFFILGPVGAVLYRTAVLLNNLTKQEDSSFANLIDASGQLRGILEWAPARLTAFIYGVAGRFNETFGYWLDHIFTGIHVNRALLVECGRVALNIEQEAEITIDSIRAALVLIDRTTIAYLILVAALSLTAFIFTL